MADHGVVQLPRIQFSFDPQTPEQSCLRLIRELSDEWRGLKPDEAAFERFTEGITNTLIKVTKYRPGETTPDGDDEAVLVRAYGNGTDTLIDREKELRAHALLASKGLAPALLARFENG